MNINDLDFEDSILISLKLENDTLHMTFKNVQEFDNIDNQFDGELIFTKVRNITENDIKTSDIKMLRPQGGVLYLEIENHHVELFVNWRDYKDYNDQEMPYEFDYEDITWQPTAAHGAAD